ENTLVLSLGTNKGDRLAYLLATIQELEIHLGDSFLNSSIYETAAWGEENQAAFLNMAIVFESQRRTQELLRQTQLIEKKIGRSKSKRWKEREIDIDIILHGQQIISSAILQVPHNHFRDRQFVLKPLCEILPNLIDPVGQKSIAQLQLICDDTLPIRKWLDRKKIVFY
ncbi:UNVERIFIED_CONTAM: hypothetical protein GTU68_062018, partial [Idotea baltica]|nr:hypothetical protein [Idotea baltica]